MYESKLLLVIWGSLCWLPQIFFGQCLESTVVLDIDPLNYQARISSIQEGMILSLDSGSFIVNVGSMDLLKIDIEGRICGQISHDHLDTIASKYITEYHGDSAFLKRVRTELDDVLCQHAVFWFRGMRPIDNSENFLIEVAVMVEHGRKAQGDPFSNLLFTVTVDSNLDICGSAYLSEFKDLSHANSYVTGSTNGDDLVVRKSYFDTSSTNILFSNYTLDGAVWLKNGYSSELQYSENATSEFSTYLPARLYHPKGWLYSNGKESHVLNDEDELVESWEVPDYDSLCIRDVVRIKDQYATISFEINPRDEGAFDYTTYIWLTDDYFHRQHLVSSYDSNRYFVAQLASKSEYLYVLLHDKRTEKYLIQTYSMKKKCPSKKFG